MSRHTKDLENGKELAYGFDWYSGYFFQVFDIPDSDGEDVLIIDECSKFTNLTKARMADLMEQYELPSTHVHKVLMDLPI